MATLNEAIQRWKERRSRQVYVLLSVVRHFQSIRGTSQIACHLLESRHFVHSHFCCLTSPRDSKKENISKKQTNSTQIWWRKRCSLYSFLFFNYRQIFSPILHFFCCHKCTLGIKSGLLPLFINLHWYFSQQRFWLVLTGRISVLLI